METFFSYIAGGAVAIAMSIGSFIGLYHSAATASSTSAVPLPPYTSNEIYQGAIDDPRGKSSATDTASTSRGSEDTTSVSPAKPSRVSSHLALDTAALPLGDGKISAVPKKGYVYSCQLTFDGRGAEHEGDWISGSVWDSTSKPHVEGETYWSAATFTNMIAGALRIITGNGLPVSEPTGIFPIAQTDPAYLIDKNPNTITAQDISWQLPASPAFASSPSCVPMGAIGIAQDGVAIFNALDAAGKDAAAHEVQDLCDGHPESFGEYHYHGPSSCMPQVDEKDTVIGFALDGFPITSLYNEQGELYSDADLDACHGTTSPIMIDGSQKTMYHYVLTREYPYTIGCFMGTPIHPIVYGSASDASAQDQPSSAQTSLPQGTQAPQAAIDACTNKPQNASCSIATAQGDRAGSCRNTPNGAFACVPN